MYLTTAGDDTVIHHNFGAGLKGGDQGLDNHLRVFVGPVMEDKSQKIHVSSLDRLVREEVVCPKADMSLLVRGQTLLPLHNDIKRVFDYAFGGGAVIDQRSRDMA